MQLLRELPYLKIYWDPDCRSVVLRWHGGFEGRDLVTGLNTALLDLRDLRPQGAQWISDTSDIGVIGESDKLWIETDWFPRFLATGVQFMAVVQPRSLIARLAVSDVAFKQAKSDITVYNCISLDEAVSWMKAQEF